MTNKDGHDDKKRWGNSGIKGVGANSPAMMEARKGFAKQKALKKRAEGHVPKHDWRKGKTSKELNTDYPDAKPGSDYMGSR